MSIRKSGLVQRDVFETGKGYPGSGAFCLPAGSPGGDGMRDLFVTAETTFLRSRVGQPRQATFRP